MMTHQKSRGNDGTISFDASENLNDALKNILTRQVDASQKNPYFQAWMDTKTMKYSTNNIKIYEKYKRIYKL